jgi:hypothetical protein
MDRLFSHLVGNIVQYVMFKKETNYLDELGCKKITNSLCALLKMYETHVHTKPTLEEFVVYFYSPCDEDCQYHVQFNDAIPALMYTVMEYGRLLQCRSLYIFLMLTNFENRYPTEEELLRNERDLLDDDMFDQDNQHEQSDNQHDGKHSILDQLIPYHLKITIKDEVCCICQEELKKGHEVITLPCMHTFHTQRNGVEECNGIMAWLKTQPVCPLCKKKVE